MEILAIPAILFVAYVIIKSKINIDTRSFFAQTLPLNRGVFGVYCFTGKQGSGKTYSLVKYVKSKNRGKQIYSNISMSGIDYIPIESIDHLWSLRYEKDVIIIFDEIFTLMQKNSRFGEEMMSFLSQMRKQENIFITTAQEWLELPMTYRRYVRIQVDCSTRPLGFLGGILKEDYYDATQMKWSQLDNEYVAPTISKKFSKYEKRYMLSYDTFEIVRALK